MREKVKKNLTSNIKWRRLLSLKSMKNTSLEAFAQVISPLLSACAQGFNSIY